MYVCIYIHAGALGSNRMNRWPPAPIPVKQRKFLESVFFQSTGC